jgi:hypothetical protein
MKRLGRFSRVRAHARRGTVGVREHARGVPDMRTVWAERHRALKGDPEVSDQLDYYADVYVKSYSKSLALGLAPDVADSDAWADVEDEMRYDEAHGDHVYVTKDAVNEHVLMTRSGRLDSLEAQAAARKRLTGRPDIEPGPGFAEGGPGYDDDRSSGYPHDPDEMFPSGPELDKLYRETNAETSYPVAHGQGRFEDFYVVSDKITPDSTLRDVVFKSSPDMFQYYAKGGPHEPSLEFYSTPQAAIAEARRRMRDRGNRHADDQLSEGEL